MNHRNALPRALVLCCTADACSLIWSLAIGLVLGAEIVVRALSGRFYAWTLHHHYAPELLCFRSRRGILDVRCPGIPQTAQEQQFVISAQNTIRT